MSLLVVSCKVTTPYQKPDISKEFSEKLFRDQTIKDSTNMARISWREIYTDTKLQALIGKALENNYDLKIALEKIKEADASFRQSQLSKLPAVTGTLGAKDIKNGNIVNVDIANYQLIGNASWEIDIWGKLNATKNAAYAALLGTDASRRAIQTQLIAQIANYYYSLLAYDQQLLMTNKAIELRQKDVEVMKELKIAARVTGAAVVQSEANLYSAQVTIPDIQNNIRQTENALSLLIGMPADSIVRSSMDEQTFYTKLDTGLPTQLLQYRPDVQVAELAFRQAFENHNFAKADLYPSLNITGGLGLSSLTINNFFNNSLYYTIGGALTQTIFGQGSKKAQLKITEAKQTEALYTFQKSLLTAGNEVSNALFRYETAVQKEDIRKKQISSLEKAVEYNQELLKYTSNTNYTDVLTSEQSLLNAQISSINDKLQKLLAISDLYRALGGGNY